jgi:hypothetical protein
VVIYLALARQLGLEAQIGAPMKRKVRHAAHPFSVQAAIGLRVRANVTYDLFAAGSSRRDIVPGDADDRWRLLMPIGNRNGGVVTLDLRTDGTGNS